MFLRILAVGEYGKGDYGSGNFSGRLLRQLTDKLPDNDSGWMLFAAGVIALVVGMVILNIMARKKRHLDNDKVA